MATGDNRASNLILDGSDLRIGVVASRWNQKIVDRLSAGVERGLASVGIADTQQFVVPGAYELPFACSVIARSGMVDALVVVGAVIRGETTHYELVAGECGRGIMDVQLATGIPVGFGVLTVENLDQAIARSEGPGLHNVGEEAAVAAVECALLKGAV